MHCSSFIRTFVFMLMLLTAFAGRLAAQQVCMKHYGVNSGLPSSECHWVMQDRKGYIWIATDAGVVKYDGYRFHTYTNTNGLPDNTVFKIHEDRSGNIWFASYSGELAYYRHQTDSVYTIPGNAFLIGHAKSAPVDFCFDQHDTLWVSYYKNGYVKLVPPNYQVCQVVQSPVSCFFIKEVDEGNHIYGTDLSHEKRKGDIPVVLDIKRHSTKQNTHTIRQQLSHTALTAKRGGRMYFTNGAAVYEIRGDGMKMVIPEAPESRDNINSIYLDHHDGLWVCTWDQGLLLYENTNRVAGLNENRFDAPQRFLPGQNVSCVFEDRENGIWICTVQNGLYFIPSMKIKHTGNTKADYVCRYKNSIVYIEGDFNVTQQFDNDSAGRKICPRHSWSNYVYDGIALVGGSPSMLRQLEGGAETPVYTLENGQKNFLRIKHAKHNGGDYFWGVDNHENALYRIHQQSGEAEKMIGFLPTVYSVEMIGNTVYLGTKSGLYSYTGQALTTINAFPGNPDTKIEAMAVWNNILLLASKGNGVTGLQKGKPVLRFTETNGLLSNICKTISADADGNIWVGTNKGVTCFRNENGKYTETRSLTVNDGLSSNEVNHILVSGELVFVATGNGINRFNRHDLLHTTDTIPIIIEKTVLNNIPVADLDGRELRYDENYLQIYFKGLLPKKEGAITYRYKLAGFDTGWVVSQNTFVQYTALPPGDYEFVIAAVSDGIRSATAPVIRFHINTPFWKSGWFIMVCVAAGLLLIVLLYRVIGSFIRKKETEKNNIRKMIIESELKALRAQMNPHFIFNAINSIQNFVLKNESLNAQKYLVKLSKLIRSVLENSKHETVLLDKEVDTLLLYMELEALRASFGFDYELHVDEQLARKTIYIPTMLLQPFVENAILHGLPALTDRRGRLEVTITETDNQLVCTIDDNGIGRAAAEEIRKKKNTGYQSMGMQVTSGRIAYLNKFAAFFITAEITDKMNHGVPEGTRVVLKIKTA